MAKATCGDRLGAQSVGRVHTGRQMPWLTSQRLPLPAQSLSVLQRDWAVQVPWMQVSLAAQAASCEQLQRPPTQVKSWAQSVSAVHSGRAAQTPCELQTWPEPHSESERQIGPQAPRRQRSVALQSPSVEQGVELIGGQPLSVVRAQAAARARRGDTEDARCHRGSGGGKCRRALPSRGVTLGRLAFLGAVLCALGACRKPGPSPAEPADAPATIEVRPNALIVRGTEFAVPETGQRFRNSASLRKAVRAAVVEGASAPPTIRSSEGVPYEVLYRAIQLVWDEVVEIRVADGGARRLARARVACGAQSFEVIEPNYGVKVFEPPDEEPPLTVALAAEGFHVAKLSGVLTPSNPVRLTPESPFVDGGPHSGAPLIPRLATGYDFARLGRKLAELHAVFPTDQRIVLALDVAISSSDLCPSLAVVAPVYPEITLGAF